MKQKVEDEIEKKLKYIGLDLENVPETLKIFEPINFKPTQKYEENKYRQYRFVPIKEIEILLSPTNRLDNIEKKYSKASTLYSYLVPDTEENILKHATFLQMLKKVKIEDIENIEKEQKELNSKIPFKVKYPGNYLWQIYYSENTDKYFMLVPTEDSDYSSFFYLLKKQLEKRKSGKIFVPINHIEYSKGIFTKSDIEDIEKYLWLFTKDWPSIYEVHDKSDIITFQIVGETEVFEKIKTPYKIILNNKLEANKFLKLIKALFILQTELPHYYKFETNINSNAELEFYYDNEKIEYDRLIEFINFEYTKLTQNSENKEIELNELKDKLDKLKKDASILELEYLSKEKQISTYLECKKSFFGKVKYFIKYNKKSKIKKIENIKHIEDSKLDNQCKEESKDKKSQKVKNNYTLEELVSKYKQYQEQEKIVKNFVLDINALKLKIKNLNKKIENAESFIKEIDKHKKSIFAFWKYANKDELGALPEGEEELTNSQTQIKKEFNYDSDFEKFAENIDVIQRKYLSKDELDSLYVATSMLDTINTIISPNETTKKDIEISLRRLKQEITEDELKTEEFDIFGGLSQDNRKLTSLANKKHREIPKDLLNILGINKKTKITEYKFELDRVANNIKAGMAKIKTNQSLTAYYASSEKLSLYKINMFNLNLENELERALKSGENKINLYKINIPEGSNLLAFTNSVFYDNQNKTLPLGMDLSSSFIIYDNNINISKTPSKILKIARYEESSNELSKIKIKTINIFK